MYQIAGANNENWTEGLAKEHNDEMINILVNTFKDHINYQDIRDKLITQKSGM
jgi:phage tail sheath gpL-like